MSEAQRRLFFQAELARLAVLLLIAAGLVAFALDARGDAEQRDVESCLGGNVTRAYLILNEQRSRSAEKDLGLEQRSALARAMFPLRDCEATVENGNRPVPLEDAVAVRYLALVEQERQPVLDGDRIVSSRPFEGQPAPP